MTPKIVGLYFATLILAGGPMAAGEASPIVAVGVAKADITPELPIRLSGYQSRATEASRVETRLFARALAIGADDQKPVVLLTVELIGIGEETSEAVAAALRRTHGIERSRVAICATHVHTGPALADVLPFMFSRDLPAEETARIALYTAELRLKLVRLAETALADRRPGRLAWGEGRADFATQRRTIVDGKWKGIGLVPAGPVDHALPVLRVTDPEGRVRAVYLSYACHCTTLGGGDLVMVFLAGEVVSEYSLRLRRELDASRLWVNAYANSVPCYVASKRMFPEGGYEVENSMDYYGWPTRLALGTEDRLIGIVRELVPAAFRQ